MQTVSCPGCGAEVHFRSAASVMAVCEFCKTTVLKDADAVKNLGKMSEVLEDYSPIQVGTSGSFGGKDFTVLGRLQLRYDAGRWNEWYVMYNDGEAAWLGDASGQYTLTVERAATTALPSFASLRAGEHYSLAGKDYTASDVRTAECIAGQGELPFKVGAGWQARVADFRSGASFLTLDYSDDGPPKMYTGQAVQLDDLKCQLLRDNDVVSAASGKYRGVVQPLDCPSCGSAIKYLPGLTDHLVCPACAAQLDASGPKAQVLAAGERVATVVTTLQLGAVATMNGAPFEIIGLMKRSDNEGTRWTEYLLHSPRRGFTWIVETDDAWERADVLDSWPELTNSAAVRLGQRSFSRLYDYPATVDFAAGAFNWRVAAGDRTNVTEYQSGQTKLAAESTAEEITWSQSVPVAADQIRAWFGASIHADKATPNVGSPVKFMMWIMALNIIPLLLSFSTTWVVVVLALCAVYFPAKFIQSLDREAP